MYKNKNITPIFANVHPLSLPARTKMIYDTFRRGSRTIHPREEVLMNPYKYETLPELIRAYREEKGYTQPQLAEKVGKSEDTIKSWESGRRTIKAAGIEKMFSDEPGLRDAAKKLLKNHKEQNRIIKKA